ncbi:single-stranded-DNA-specific exonuclease RecJ [Puniceicoccales bacterium CK1056]|uniref:Single-stranded-DNA-specific exonuclease RecJ n=1 Tax=Oceanipulchritudo coccoides TaxID=2706888 RepID=A0A6B2M163_9BACT|nr:single-stranded-DNA-specific exonuclease RecJ [Oceanipulchritudo coccoides]NDV61854.1 single-stranded-DNA-specific exonuclease RecJ [Oceanipulchritudo coccoides]
MRWIKSSLDETLATAIAREQGLSEISARLLAGRNLTTMEEVEGFLNPGLSTLGDPLSMGGMPEAVARVESALKKQESVLIFGDYDVDGVTSTVFLTHFLRRFGLSPKFVVPKRLEEGYGLGIDSLSRALEEGKPDLMIAVDCGTSSSEEVAWLREQGISVIILDHHTSKESLPDDCIMVNPHVHDPDSVPWKNLCSVGLVFKFCHAFLKVMRQKGDALAATTDLREYLDLVALGTVADLVDLTGENRILVRNGLRYLEKCQRPGICALMEVAGLTLGDTLSPSDIGFRLGPRINASGRLDDAALPIQLLLSENWQTCRETALTLDEFNRDRQDIERSIAELAEAQVSDLYPDHIGIVVHASDWHSGVVGIVASRLARKFHRPCLVLGSEGEGLAKGSGRSVEGVDLVEILKECSDVITQWGGHPMAVGLTIQEDKVNELRESFNAALREKYSEGIPEQVITIEAEARPEELTSTLLSELDQLAPYGQGNPEPVFALRGVVLPALAKIGTAHLKFGVPRPGLTGPIECIGWNAAENPPPTGKAIDLAVRFGWHSWRGQRSPRLTLLDWQQSR